MKEVKMQKENSNWEIGCLFVLANLGDFQLLEYWLGKKKLNINLQDEDGNTALHYAVRGNHINLIIFLLQNKAVISWNKEKQSPLQLAYNLKQHQAVREITKSIIEGNNAIDEDQKLDLYINDFITYLKKNYLDRNIFYRVPAKHIKRANALISAAKNCYSMKEFRDLLNNQLNLFKNIALPTLPKRILEERWSKVIKNRPSNVNNSHFYKTVNSFVVDRLSKKITNKNPVNILERRCYAKINV